MTSLRAKVVELISRSGFDGWSEDRPALADSILSLVAEKVEKQVLYRFKGYVCPDLMELEEAENDLGNFPPVDRDHTLIRIGEKPKTTCYGKCRPIYVEVVVKEAKRP